MIEPTKIPIFGAPKQVESQEDNTNDNDDAADKDNNAADDDAADKDKNAADDNTADNDDKAADVDPMAIDVNATANSSVMMSWCLPKSVFSCFHGCCFDCCE